MTVKRMDNVGIVVQDQDAVIAVFTELFFVGVSDFERAFGFYSALITSLGNPLSM
jgi:hypothetical protein